MKVYFRKFFSTRKYVLFVQLYSVDNVESEYAQDSDNSIEYWYQLIETQDTFYDLPCEILLSFQVRYEVRSLIRYYLGKKEFELS